VAEPEATLYEAIGGEPVFRRLVAAFYEGVEDDPVLRPLYPESLEAPKEKLALFLAQYFGGPDTYSQLRGHPRLRLRHLPFVIGPRQRNAWLTHMTAALDAAAIAEPYRGEMLRYFSDASAFLMNQEPLSRV
jgi:hemoglobin